MAVAALVLIGVWVVTVMAVRMAVQLRRTGDTGFRGLSATRPAHWWANVLMLVPAVLMVAAPVADLAGLARVPGLDTPVLQVLGVVLAILGAGATFVAQLTMGESWRVGVDESERTDLVTSGVFGLVRNPIYTTAVVAVAGLGLMAPNALSVLSVAGLILALQLHVRKVEEPYLTRVHGAAYRRYTAAVGRFVPLVGRTKT